MDVIGIVQTSEVLATSATVCVTWVICEEDDILLTYVVNDDTI